MRVTFLVSTLRYGGAERHTIELFNRLDLAVFNTSLIYLKRKEDLLFEIQKSRQDAVWCADFGSGWDTAGLLRLRTRLQHLSPDILVCVNTYPLFYGHLARFVARLSTRTRIIEVFHTTELSSRAARRIRYVYRWFFNSSDCIVYVSETQQRYWEARGLRAGCAIYIHNGVDTERFRDRFTLEEKNALRASYGLEPDDFLVGICAALRREKMHGDLLEAIARLKRDGLSVKGLIIGDGPLRRNLEGTINALGLQQDVAITGFQHDVRPFVAACDCMALVSHTVETFSISALESMAMGKPMIMSDVGGAAEQVIPGKVGFLFPRGDIDRLSDSLRKLALSLGDCETMGASAHRHVTAHFSIDKMVDQYARLFLDLHQSIPSSRTVR